MFSTAPPFPASSKALDPSPALNPLVSAPTLFPHPLSSEYRTSLQISVHLSSGHRQEYASTHLRPSLPVHDRISLNRFHIPAIQLQLICDTGMSQGMEYNLRKIILPDQFVQPPVDHLSLLVWQK